MLNINNITDVIKISNHKGALHNSPHLTGLSGEALYGTLQRLSELLLDENTVYLEVGVFQGLTLLSSSLANNSTTFYGIDNFAYFDKQNKNKTIIKNRIEKLGITNTSLIDEDYEDALENLEDHIGDKKVGLYFIDGPHDYRSQLMCLQLIKPYLAENAIILIDDSNYRFVRQANRDFLITHESFKFIYESYTPSHPINMNAQEKEDAQKGWWNGINIIGKGEFTKELDNKFLPATERDRTIYENEQILHAVKYPLLLLKAFHLINKVNGFGILNFINKNPKNHLSGHFRHHNTFSDKLESNNYNDSIK